MPLTEQDRIKIKTLSAEGVAQRKICRIIHCSRRTVQKWQSSASVSDQANIQPGRVRKRLLDDSQYRKLESIAKRHKREGTDRLLPQVKKYTGVNISARSVRRYLQDNDFSW